MTEIKKLPVKKKSSKGGDKPLLREVAYRRLKNAIQEGELNPVSLYTKYISLKSYKLAERLFVKHYNSL